MEENNISLAPMTEDMYFRYFQDYTHDPDLNLPGQAYVPHVYSEEWIKKYIQRQRDLKRIPLAILRGDEVVGEIVLKKIEARRCATMGIALKNAAYKDQGIGTAAERLVIDYVFYELDIPTLYADTLQTNTRSQHVLEKAGFSYVGEDRDFKYYRIDRPQEIILKSAQK